VHLDLADQIEDAPVLDVRLIVHEAAQLIAGNLLVGDCETIAQRLCDEIRAARPSHMMFHFQVGASSQASTLRTMEKLMLEIVSMVERELGPLAEIGAPTRRATPVTQ
jgi:hypothetical protein